MLFPFRFHLKQMHSKSISRPHFARSYALKDNITLFVIPKIYTICHYYIKVPDMTRILAADSALT